MNTLVAIAFISASLLHAVSGLECYVCNTHVDGSKCEEPHKKYKVECGSDEDGKEYTVCRKLNMYMDMNFGKYHPIEERVHRACAHLGMEDDAKPCYYKSGYNTRSYVCHCDTDGCNTAPHFVPTLAALLPIAAVVVLRGMF